MLYNLHFLTSTAQSRASLYSIFLLSNIHLLLQGNS